MILKLKHQTMDIVIVRFHQGGAPYRAANGTLNLTMDRYITIGACTRLQEICQLATKLHAVIALVFLDLQSFESLHL